MGSGKKQEEGKRGKQKHGHKHGETQTHRDTTYTCLSALPCPWTRPSSPRPSLPISPRGCQVD